VIGIDQLSGSARFTFDQPYLLDGIDVVVVAVGLFALGETLHVAWQLHDDRNDIIPVKGRVWLTRDELRRSWRPWLRGTAIGFPLGTLPAGGAEVPTFLSYSLEKQACRDKDEFGKGAIEGVAGPEAANNAAFTGVLVPLLTLGLPTSATAAIMLSAFQSYNIQPGPQLFERQGTLLWALIASLYIGNVMLVLLNLPLVRLWVKLLEVPRSRLYGSILVFAMLGVFASSANPADLYVMFAIGVLGYGMRRYDFPIGPMIVGLILGPVAESQFRRAMSISQGDATIFFTRPLSLGILIAAVLAAILPVLPAIVARVRGRRAPARLVLGHADAD
jgi:putative tricarboxylic transport membrane protein